MTTPADVWAPFGLVMRCGPLELRAITDDDMPELLDLIADGIHTPDTMPFTQPWTQGTQAEVARGATSYWWSTRASFSPESWTLDLVVRHDGRIVGVQGIATKDFLVTRTGETGSWLGRRHQGRGIGTAMRKVMCAFLFDHLDFAEITSAAFSDNPRSLAVSRTVGYVDNGAARVQRRPGELAESRSLVLTSDRLARPRDPVQVTGVEQLRVAIGLG